MGRTYYIIRVGSNGANQHFQQYRLIGVINGAKNRDKYYDKIQDLISRYNNQYIIFTTLKDAKNKLGNNFEEDAYYTSHSECSEFLEVGYYSDM